MKKNEKRDSVRKKCKQPANLICENDTCGDETYQCIEVVDQSETGLCITSPAPIDVSGFLTVSIPSNDKNETYPAEFVWTHRDKKNFMAGLKKV